MQWLAERLGNLHELAGRHLQYRDLAAAEVAGSANAQKQASDAFSSAVQSLVEDIGNRPGVEGCFASHEGLVVEHVGSLDDIDGLAAMAHSLVDGGSRAAETLRMGALRQMVIIAEQHKLALFAVGPMALGVLALSSTSLGEALTA